ncbi:hypothetical protein ACI65C_006106 [Semiaphis heraclei]
MKISLYLSVLFLTLVGEILTANVQQHSRQNYCGSKLADIMKVVCESNYNGPNLQKRSIIDSELPKIETTSSKPSRSIRSVKRSIIDECCRRPCYLSELTDYCGNHQ